VYRSTAGHRQASRASSVVWPCLICKSQKGESCVEEQQCIDCQMLAGLGHRLPQKHAPTYLLSISDELEQLRVSNNAKPESRRLLAALRALTKLLAACTHGGASNQHASHYSYRYVCGHAHTPNPLAIGINEHQTAAQIHRSHSEACSTTTRSWRDKGSRQSGRDSAGSQSHHGLNTGGQKQGLQEEI
jgi:hypothetical protein